MPRPFAWAMSLRVELRCDIGVTVYKIMRNCLFISTTHVVYEGADGTGWSTLSAFIIIIYLSNDGMRPFPVLSRTAVKMKHQAEHDDMFTTVVGKRKKKKG